MIKAVLISIHPEHVAKILSGIKVFEYRKIMPAKEISHLVLYCTAPVKKVVAIAEIAGCLEGPPSRLWTDTAYGAGITRKFYREYFSGQRRANSFALGNVYEMSEPFELSELTSCKAPPQSFCYLNTYDIMKVLNKASAVPSTPPSLIFVGGIHGVGKSTISQKAFNPLGYHCMTASSLISSYGRRSDNNKKVDDLSENQMALIKQLEMERGKHSRILLDGHFTLINNEGHIEPISLCVFQKMNPTQLILIKGDPNEIVRRLAMRDGNKWDLAFVTKFQKKEEEHSKYVSNTTGIPLLIFENTVSFLKVSKSVRKRES